MHRARPASPEPSRPLAAVVRDTPEASQARAERRLVRLGLVSGVALAAMLGLLSFLGAAFSRDHDEAVHELVQADRLHRALATVLQLAVDGETAGRGYVLTGDRAFLAPLEDARAELPGAIASAAEMLSDRHGDAVALELTAAVASRTAFTEDTVALMDSGDRDAALSRIATGEGRTRMNRIRTVVAEASEREDGTVSVALSRVEVSRGRARTAFAFVVVVAALLALGLGGSLRVHVARNRALLRRSAEDNVRFRMLAERARDLVCILRADGSMEYASPSCEALLGYSPEEMMVLPRGALLAEDDASRVLGVVARALAEHRPPPPFRHTVKRKDGGTRLFETTIQLVEDPDGAVVRYHSLGRDVTDDDAEDRRLEALAKRDELTGLLNRRGFMDAGEPLLERAAREGGTVLMFFCDVNGLKSVNDALGHAAGDALIRDAAELLKATARSADLVARLGGDEFVVLGVVQNAAGADAFRQRLTARMRAHNAEADRKYRVSVSIGSATREGREPLDALIARADAAMYRDKQGRRAATTASGEWIVKDGPDTKPS